MGRFVESIVRTNRLYCTDCRKKLSRGETAIFKLSYGEMDSVYCEKCGSQHYDAIDAYHDSIHPFSDEAFE